jgi:uncharacterized membrane protein
MEEEKKEQQQNQEETTSGLKPNIAALLCYLLGWITGLIFFLIEKNKFVRFHAMQSIVVFGALSVVQIVLTMIPILGWALIPVVTVVGLILWIVLMVKAYQGEKLKLPLAGDIAEKNA